MYSFDDECTLRTVTPENMWSTPNQHPTLPPLPPQGMKSDCLPLVCVDCVDISVHKYIYIFFLFFFLMYILNSTVNFFSKFPPLLETSFL